MAATDAPTSPRGTLGTGGYLGGYGGGYDQLEHVIDLTWPLSVRTYAKMRHDPTLASILAAYRLPILAARWEIDPRGASPRMVQVCADSLGLPVRGQPDDPGPVRRRGVQWLAHMRSVLSMLTFGHAAYEPVFDVSSGSALLASLGERLQLSIAEIEVTDQGDLKSITQYGDITKPSPPPIPADRLLWHVHEREGANLAGTSMLRPSFGPWLLKQDALRTAGTSLRRWGAGIPVVEWDRDSSPTSEQRRAALAVASSARGGDTAGADMPPGARLRIQGVEGTYPDALPQIRYHDEQMARSCLASMLDLGSTTNGSRALGQSFAELLGLAQQGLADQVAETSTQLCAKLTDYNEGEDAASPGVAVSSIVEDEQALAQSVAGLITAGAISVDDDLEDWLRQVFRAPARAASSSADPAKTPDQAPDAGATQALAKQRDVAETIQKIYLGVGTVLSSDEAREIANKAGADLSIPGPDFGPSGLLRGAPATTPADPAADGTAPVAAARPVAAATRPVNDTPVTDPAAPGAAAPLYRPLTPDEEAAGLDPQQAEDEHAAVVASLIAAWLLIRRGHRDQLAGQVQDTLTASGVTGLVDPGLTLDTSDAATVIGAAMLYGADAGVRLAIAEAARQGVTLTAPTVDSTALEALAAALASALGQATASTAAQQAVQLAASGMAPADVAAGVAAALDELPEKWMEDQLAGAVWTGMGAGRGAVYTTHPPTYLLASEVLDRGTCRGDVPGDIRCWEIDGTRYATPAAAFEDYPSGRYRRCRGGVRCRGQIIAVHQTGGQG